MKTQLEERERERKRQKKTKKHWRNIQIRITTIHTSFLVVLSWYKPEGSLVILTGSCRHPGPYPILRRLTLVYFPPSTSLALVTYFNSPGFLPRIFFRTDELSRKSHRQDFLHVIERIYLDYCIFLSLSVINCFHLFFTTTA